MVLGVLAACLVMQDSLAAPSASSGLRSYHRARAALEAGVEALGGRAALVQLRTVQRTIRGGWVGNGQTREPPAQRAPTLAVSPYVFEDRVYSFIDYVGTRWAEDRLEASAASPGDRARRIEVVTPDSGFETTTYYEERPLLRRYASPDLPALITAQLRRYPEGLLRMALDRMASLQWVDRAEELGRAQEVISFADATGARVLLYFDAETHLPTKSETLADHAVVGDSFRDIVYLDYRPVGSLRLPTHIIARAAGIPVEEHFIDSTAFNTPLPAAVFRPPASSLPVVDDPTTPLLQPLGDGLYLIRGPYNSVVAEFRDHLVLFEAGLGSAWTEAVLRVIEKAFPTKPLRYLVASHFHYDHVAGIRPFVARGATIFTTRHAAPVIEHVAASSRTIAPDALTLRPGAPRIEIVREGRILEDAMNRVEVHQVGPTPHVEQILIAYYPRQRVLAVADLVDISSPELVLVGPDAEVLSERLQRLGLDVEQIVPVHGTPGTPDMLARGLALRAKYLRTR